MAKYVRILKNDPMGRFRRGEIGKIMPSKAAKYDFCVDLGTQYSVLFDKIILAKRHYYFHKEEVSSL
jgi:hypothetical protein